MRPLYLLLCVLLFGALSCRKETKYSSTPVIKFMSLSTDSVQAGSDETVSVKFEFEDGDGDIGFEQDNVFFIDSRFLSDTIPFRIPIIPDRFNPENGIKGIIQVDYEAAFLLLRPDSLHQNTDTLQWSIFMRDKAGHSSNLIGTSSLIIGK